MSNRGVAPAATEGSPSPSYGKPFSEEHELEEESLLFENWRRGAEPLWKTLRLEHLRKQRSGQHQQTLKSHKEERQQQILQRIVATRKNQGLPPFFAVISGPTVRPYRMEELSLIVGRNTPSNRAAQVNLGTNNGRVSREHVRLFYHKGQGCYCAMNLSKNGFLLKHGQRWSKVSAVGVAMPLSNPAVLDIEGTLLYIQVFFVVSNSNSSSSSSSSSASLLEAKSSGGGGGKATSSSNKTKRYRLHPSHGAHHQFFTNEYFDADINGGHREDIESVAFPQPIDLSAQLSYRDHRQRPSKKKQKKKKEGTKSKISSLSSSSSTEDGEPVGEEDEKEEENIWGSITKSKQTIHQSKKSKKARKSFEPSHEGHDVEASPPRKKAATGITFSQMIQTALQEMGGSATQPVITKYIEQEYSEEIAGKRTWKNSVSGVLSSSKLFIQEPLIGQSGKKERQSLWRLRDYAAKSTAEDSGSLAPPKADGEEEHKEKEEEGEVEEAEDGGAPNEEMSIVGAKRKREELAKEEESDGDGDANKTNNEQTDDEADGTTASEEEDEERAAKRALGAAESASNTVTDTTTTTNEPPRT
ncbi:hypothetical protein QOT17_002847 [Balamuthia mandrillaris]